MYKIKLWSIKLRQILLVYIILSIAILAFGISYYYVQKRALISSIQEELKSVSTIKSQEINQWLRERNADANVLSLSLVFNVNLMNYILNHDIPSQKLLLQKIHTIKEQYDYDEVILINSMNKIILSTSSTTCLGTETLSCLKMATQKKEPILSDIYWCNQCNQIHLDVISNIYNKKSGNKLIGYVILRMNPDTYLFESIQNWPTNSKSAEIVLFRMENDSVVYLNNLKHGKKTALNLKIPIDKKEYVTVHAIEIGMGYFEGFGYKNNRVLSYAVKIKGTDWFLLAKIDKAEVLHSLKSVIWFISIISVLILLLLGSVVIIINTSDQKKHWKRLFALERERKLLISHFEYLVKYANDIIILANENGQIIEANDRAIKTYQYSRFELKKKNLSDLGIFSFSNQGKTINFFKISDKPYQSVHYNKSGDVFHVEICEKVIAVDSTKYYQAIIRDITERIQANKNLEESNGRFSKIFHESPVPMAITNIKTQKVVDINKSYQRLSGYSSNEVIGKTLYEMDIYPKKEQEEKSIEQMRNDSELKAYELSMKTKTGKMHEIISWNNLLELNEETNFSLQTAIDVTELRKAEKELHVREKTLQLFVDYAPAAIAMFDKEMKYLAASRRYIKDYRITNKELIGYSHYEVFPDIPERWKEIHRRCLSGAIEKVEEDPFARDDGSFDYVHWEIHPWYEDSGTIGGILLFSEVVTEKVKANKAMVQSEEHFRTLFEQASDGIFIADETGKYTDVNEMGCHMMGYSREEITRMTILDLITEDEAHKLESEFEILSSGKIAQRTWKFRRKDKSVFYGEVVSKKLTDGRLQAFVRDITVQKKMMEELARNETRYRETLDNLIEGCYIIDFEGRYIYINNEAARQNDSNVNEVIGYVNIERFPEFKDTKIYTAYNRVLKNRKAIRDEFEIKKMDGNSYYYDINIIPIPEGILVFSQDITERKTALLELIKAKEVAEENRNLVNLKNEELLRINFELNEKNNQYVSLNEEYQSQNEELAKAKESAEENEKNYRSLLEFAPVGIGVHCDGEIVFINPAGQKILGAITNDQLIGKPITEIVQKERLEIAKARLNSLLRGETGFYSAEEIYTRVDGIPVEVQVMASPCTFNATTSVQVIFTDITERKRAEEALRRSEKSYRDLINCMNETIWVINFNGDLIDVNDAATKETGYTTEELLKLGIYEIDAFLKPENIDDLIKRIPKEKIQIFESVHRTKYGKTYPVEISSTLVTYQGQQAILSIARNISERKRNEIQLRLQGAALNAAANAILITDITGSILWVNKSFAALTGYSAEEAIGKNPRELVKSGRQHARFYEEMWKTILSGKTWLGELINKRKDGSLYFEELSITPLTDSDGKINYFISIKQDISMRKQSEELIAKERTLLKTLIDNLPSAVFVKDKNYRNILANNSHLANMIGLKRSIGLDSTTELIGKTDYEIIPKVLADEYNEEDRKIIEEGLSIINKEEERIDPQGNKTWLLVSKIPLKDKEGNITGLIGITTDITEIKSATENLNRERILLRTLINNLPNGVFIKDKNFRKIVANPIHIDVVKGHLRVLGKETEIDILDKTDFEVYPKELAEQYFEEDQKIIKDGIGIFNKEVISYDTNGKTLCNLLTKIPLFGKSNEIIGMLGVSTDITDRKNAEIEVLRLNKELEQRVAERTAELLDLYNNAPCGYHSLDENGLFILVNDTELKWFGYEREELIGKVIAQQLMTDESKMIFATTFPKFKEQGYLNNTELEFIRKDGSILPVLLSATIVIDDNGNFIRSRSTIVDNTDRKMAEKNINESNAKLELSNKELEAFAYSVSHDLRAPLRHITGFIRQFLDNRVSPLSEEEMGYLKTITNSAEEMGNLIDALLSFSRLNLTEIQKQTIHSSEIIQGVIQLFSEEIKKRKIKLIIKELHKTNGDIQLIRQVWINLVSNAIKYTRKKEHAVIEIGSYTNENEDVFYVKDNGAGFNMKYSDKLFGVFQRLHKARDFEGIGIGLANINRIVSRHGGRCWAEGEVDKGAVFYFSLPRL